MPWTDVPVATFVQLALTSVIGDVIAYADEKAGSLVQEVVPLRRSEKLQENSGSVLLELHTEDAFHPHKPDFITLLCVRPDHARSSCTVVSSVVDAMSSLSDSTLEVLREPLFRIRVSSSFGKQDLATAPLPVLSGSTNRPELVADFHAMSPLSGLAAAAFDELRAAMVASLRGACLEEGDLLVIDNRVAVHGRTAFKANYDANERWLRRCFGVADLWQSRDARLPGSRVCAPLAVEDFVDVSPKIA